MSIKERLEKLQNKKYTNKDLIEMKEAWRDEFRNRPHAPLHEGITNLKVEFKVDEDGDTIFTDGYNYLIIGNEEAMDLPYEEKMKIVFDTLDDFKNDESMKSEYDYWMSVLKQEGLVNKNMKLPKLTKKVAKQIDDNYQKFLKNEELKEALREDDMLKAKALAEYLGVEVEDIENTGIDLYEVDGDEYLVLTDEEATEKAGEEIQNVFDDLGLDSFTPSFKEWIMDNCVSTGEVYDWMLNSYRSYVDDIELENDYTYGNRLIQELYDNGLLEDEDFEVDEDGEILYDTLKDDINLEDKKEEYANQLASTMDPMDWLKEIYSEKDLAKLLVDEDMIDMEALIEECIRLDGRGHFIAYFDSRELDLGNNLFAYRVS